MRRVAICTLALSQCDASLRFSEQLLSPLYGPGVARSQRLKSLSSSRFGMCWPRRFGRRLERAATFGLLTALVASAYERLSRMTAVAQARRWLRLASGMVAGGGLRMRATRASAAVPLGAPVIPSSTSLKPPGCGGVVWRLPLRRSAGPTGDPHSASECRFLSARQLVIWPLDLSGPSAQDCTGALFWTASLGNATGARCRYRARPAFS